MSDTDNKDLLNNNDKDSEYEDICYLCHRTERTAGKMFKLPNHICVCSDCMHKTMDTMTQMDYQTILKDIGNVPGANQTIPSEADTEAETETETDESPNANQNMGQGRIPNISFLNLSDLQNMMGPMSNKQKIKKKRADGERTEPVIDIKNIPQPHKIKESLDEYVIGQAHAKKVISVAIYNHYKRVAAESMGELAFAKDLSKVEIEKSNMLMIGPTGCGKTYLVKTLAKLLDVPLAIADATSLTEAGYIGDDIESVLSKLLVAADNDVERAEQGIIFIDEIDKLAKKKDTHSRDVSGESVQQGLLKLLEGSEVEVPVGASSKNAMVPLTTINTKNILFICGGAFPDLDEVIKQRLRKKTSIGFNAELKDSLDKRKDILKEVTVDDIKKFGMIPEFVGRLPVIFTLEGLSKEMMVEILKAPKDAIIKQYQKLLALDEVQLTFEDEALEVIAEKALEKETGARALRSIIEEFMLDIMYEIPKDDNIGRVTITRAYIEGTGGPIIDLRGGDKSFEERETMKAIPLVAPELSKSGAQ